MLARLIALFLILLCRHAFAAEKQRPNIILITLDTTRADRMGFLGSTRRLTPNLDAMARDSVVFTRAYSHAPITTASHATILTGTYPQFNRVNDFGVPLSPRLPSLPDVLHKNGYHTGAFVGSLILDPLDGTAPGFDRGFDVYDAGFHPRRHGADRYKTVERRAEDVVTHALAWLSHLENGPFFLWVHLYDAHDPYDPPASFKEKYNSQPYDGEIAYTDSAVGKLFGELKKHGLYDVQIWKCCHRIALKGENSSAKQVCTIVIRGEVERSIELRHGIRNTVNPGIYSGQREMRVGPARRASNSDFKFRRG